jgi:hypothetical protein
VFLETHQFPLWIGVLQLVENCFGAHAVALRDRPDENRELAAFGISIDLARLCARPSANFARNATVAF